MKMARIGLYQEENELKKERSRVWLCALSVLIMSGCPGCAKTEADPTEKRDEEYTQDNTLTEDIPESDLGETGNNGEKDYGEFPEPVLFPEEFAFEYEVWKNETTQIKTPGGIVYDGESMLVCDTGNHCVARLTTDGEFVESYGELGSETGNFVKPTSLVLYKDEIYVLDAGNMRVQVFDKEMQFLREILFEAAPLSNSGKYVDMAIDGDGTIYIAADSTYREETGLFYIEEGALRRISGEFSGYLAEKGGVVYAVNAWQFITSEGGYNKRPGVNQVYEISRTELKKVCELPYMYAPMDFIMGEDEIYTLSTVWGEMNRVSMEGELLEALLLTEELQLHDMYLCMQDENTFYVADAKGYLYKVFRAGD